MNTARTVRKLAVAVAYGSSSVGLLGGALWGVMKTEAKLARRTIGSAVGKPPSGDGVYGRDQPGAPVRFAMLGDSSAAGYGVSSGLDTPAALIGEGLSHMTGRPVRVTCRAFVGARTSDLDAQIDRVLAYRPEVAAVVIGTNDITHSVPLSESVRNLELAIHRLRAAGCEVVVGTCPDLGVVRPLRRPLRQYARMQSLRLARMQEECVADAGGRPVLLGSLLKREFDHAPDELFGEDKFHPSETGYVSMVTAMLPSIAVACGAWDEDDDATYTGGMVLPVSFVPAAVEPDRRWAAVRARRRS